MLNKFRIVSTQDEVGVVIVILIFIVSSLYVIFFRANSDSQTYPDWQKAMYSERFFHLRIPADIFKRKASSKNKIVRQAKRLLKFVLRKNPESTFDFGSINFRDSNGVLDPNATPLLCFVNCKSGGKQGKAVMAMLQEFLGPHQVFDLSAVDPREVLRAFSVLPSLRLLVAGGDGSVGWLLTCLESLPPDSRPPLAVLPLGTGNDLARVLGWGHTVESSELVAYLDHIQYASIATVDRWEVIIERTQIQNSKIAEKRVSFNNYVGIGVDASIVNSFHEARNQEPHRFSSQLVNKLWYGIFGGREILVPTNRNIGEYLSLVVDGQEVALPEGTEGIILSNISSYGGGSRLWREESDEDSAAIFLDERLSEMKGFSSADDGYSEEPFSPVDDSSSCGSPLPYSTHRRLAEQTPKWRPESFQDGLLEVCSVKGSLHLAQIQIGLLGADKLRQGKEIVIMIKANDEHSKIPVQVDGEPWIESAGCKFTIRRYDQAQLLQYSSGSQYASIATEVVDWGYRTGVLTADQRQTLLAECSRRLESRKRLRDVIE